MSKEETNKIKLIKVGNYTYKCLKDSFGDICVCVDDSSDWFRPRFIKAYPVIGYLEASNR